MELLFKSVIRLLRVTRTNIITRIRLFKIDQKPILLEKTNFLHKWKKVSIKNKRLTLFFCIFKRESLDEFLSISNTINIFSYQIKIQIKDSFQ